MLFLGQTKCTPQHSQTKKCHNISELTFDQVNRFCNKSITFWFNLNLWFIIQWFVIRLLICEMRTMPMFFQDEFNIYRKMLLRESQKSIAGLEILNSFVSFFLRFLIERYRLLYRKWFYIKWQTVWTGQSLIIAFIGSSNPELRHKINRYSWNPAKYSVVVDFLPDSGHIQHKCGNAAVVNRSTYVQRGDGKFAEKQLVTRQGLAVWSVSVSNWRHFQWLHFICFGWWFKAVLH